MLAQLYDFQYGARNGNVMAAPMKAFVCQPDRDDIIANRRLRRSRASAK